MVTGEDGEMGYRTTRRQMKARLMKPSPRDHEGPCQYCDAVETFNAWVAENDPGGSMTLLEQIEAYAAADITGSGK
jgi:hypothetical protein